ncbi:hypothetical protein GALMADRAFT_272537 [Galerina marginata CBS 339.88]|uniref:Uncharacterized protein n=1 Tax=Galerina marginata (strain CBS 339.88) TaxID=685588 RepID=A0A067SCJ2_GALM3|nr:hypothetical protein GALMADRAFT_272537 [Galerina marginata CBS 339.88]
MKLMECLSSFDVALWSKSAAVINITLFLPGYCALLSNLGAQELLKLNIEEFDRSLLSEIHLYGYSKMAMWCYIALGGKRTLQECSRLMDEPWNRPVQMSVTIWHWTRHTTNDDCFNFLRRFFYNIDRAGDYAMSKNSHLRVALHLTGKFSSKFLRPSDSIYFDPAQAHAHYMSDPVVVLTVLAGAPLSNELFRRVSSVLRELDFCNEKWKPVAQNILTYYLKRCKADPSFSLWHI